MGWLESHGVSAGLLADAPSQVAHIEDLLLLSQYADAADASANLVPRLLEVAGAGDPTAAPLAQRALVAAVQAHFLCGRQAEFESLVEGLGLQCLAVPSFLTWVLMLLESGQASAARLRVERYMAALLTLLRDKQAQEAQQLQQQQQEAQRQQRAQQQAVWHPQVEAGARHPVAAASVAATAATAQDRAALARVYSQDVLALGLGLHREALAWLQPEGREEEEEEGRQPGRAQAQCQEKGQGREEEGRRQGQRRSDVKQAGAEQAAVSAVELLGSNEAVALLRDELQQLLEASGVGEEQLQQPHPVANSHRATASQAKPSAPPLPSVPAPNAATVAVGTVASAGRRAARATPSAPSRHRGHGLWPQPASSPLSGLLAALRTWLSAAFALAVRLASGAAVQLTRAQAWLVCSAASTAARLRAAAAAGRSSVGSSSGGSSRGGASAGSTAAVLVLAAAAVVAVAVQAEVPHLRSAVGGQLAAAVGMLREALSMGLSLHPNPVAAAAVY